MEGICTVRLSVYDLRYPGTLHGDDDRGKNTLGSRAGPKARPADPSPAAVGTFMLWRCISDRDEALLTAPGTVDGVHEPPLRRHTILCHQFIRPLRERGGVLPTGRILFLGLLFLHEFHLDRGPGLLVGPSPHVKREWLTHCIRLSFR